MSDQDDELDDASVRSMRAVWLSMRDEEPPTAGMSALLAAAATKAAEMRAEPAWWERVLHVLRRPPALAFATVLVLIGGAVLVTRTSDKQPGSMVATEQPPGSPPMEVPPAVVAPAEETPARIATDQSPAPPPPPAPSEPSPVAESTPPKQVAKDVKRTPVKPRPQTYKEEAEALEESNKATEPVAGKGAAGEDMIQSPGTRAPAARPSADDRVVLSERAAPPAPPVVQLLRQAESAAARGDCAAVRTIATKIRQQDDAFYKERVLSHAAVAKCL